MSAVLRVKTGNGIQKIPCKAVVTLGRDKNSDIVLKDLMASRNHAMIQVDLTVVMLTSNVFLPPNF